MLCLINFSGLDVIVRLVGMQCIFMFTHSLCILNTRICCYDESVEVLSIYSYCYKYSVIIPYRATLTDQLLTAVAACTFTEQ